MLPSPMFCFSKSVCGEGLETSNTIFLKVLGGGGGVSTFRFEVRQMYTFDPAGQKCLAASELKSQRKRFPNGQVAPRWASCWERVLCQRGCSSQLPGACGEGLGLRCGAACRLLALGAAGWESRDAGAGMPLDSSLCFGMRWSAGASAVVCRDAETAAAAVSVYTLSAASLREVLGAAWRWCRAPCLAAAVCLSSQPCLSLRAGSAGAPGPCPSSPPQASAPAPSPMAGFDALGSTCGFVFVAFPH